MNLSSSDVMPIVSGALRRGQRVRLVATGASMRPFIHDGDLVEIEPCDEPRRGDVVLADDGAGRYLLHRVVATSGGTFHLAGDAVARREGPFGNGLLRGRVVAVHRKERSRSCQGWQWRAAGLLWRWGRPLTPRALFVALRLRAVVRRGLLRRSASFGRMPKYTTDNIA